MKNKLTTALATLLILVLCLTSDSSIAQTKTKSATMKECCMMKDGKMMHMKNGQMIPMEKDMTMKNGTICKANGECVMKDGKVIKMREGECMDMMGNMENCSMTTDHS
ncbi:MAG TPA: hypothetical protein PKY12_07875, partial [Catalimonadaceae bacterium]|nr:hypothetical protein [Catalimonadaceae bacterium]